MKRLIIALLVGGILFTGAFAFAALQPFASQGLGAGDADVDTCTEFHIIAEYDVEWFDHHGYLVTDVNLHYGHDHFEASPTCDGWDVWVTLTTKFDDPGETPPGTLPIAIGSCHGVFDGFDASLVCDPPQVDPEDVDDIHIVVMEPSGP